MPVARTQILEHARVAGDVIVTGGGGVNLRIDKVVGEALGPALELAQQVQCLPLDLYALSGTKKALALTGASRVSSVCTVCSARVNILV